MIKRKTIIWGIVLALVLLAFIGFWGSKDYNGNTLANAEKVLAKELDTKNVHAFHLIDREEYRFMVYVTDKSSGYAVFKQIKEGGDYLLEKVTPKSKMLKRAKDSYVSRYSVDYMIIWTENPAVHGFAYQFTKPETYSNTIHSQFFTDEEEGIRFNAFAIQLPEADGFNEYTMEYWFYDQNGSEVQ